MTAKKSIHLTTQKKVNTFNNTKNTKKVQKKVKKKNASYNTKTRRAYRIQKIQKRHQNPHVFRIKLKNVTKKHPKKNTQAQDQTKKSIETTTHKKAKKHQKNAKPASVSRKRVFRSTSLPVLKPASASKPSKSLPV
jgi:transketolase